MIDSRNNTQRSNSKNHTSKLFMFVQPFTMEEEAVVLSPAKKDRKKKNRWQALRAALKETSLMRKIISRRKANKTKMARSKDEDDVKISSSPPTIIRTCRTTSNVSSTSGSSSSAPLTSSSRSDSFSSIASHSSSSRETTHSPRSPLSKHRKQINNAVNNNNRRKGCCDYSNTSARFMLMIMIGLLLLILWGRCLAIVYTAVWFYMVRPVRRRPCPCNSKDDNWHHHSGEINEFDWGRYQRKFIMEGSLDRSLVSSGSMQKSREI